MKKQFNISEDDMVDLFARYPDFKKCASIVGVTPKEWEERWYNTFNLPEPMEFLEDEEPNKISSERYQFGIMSDMHLGSKYENIDAMNEFAKECRDRGITTMLCAGDVSEGIMPREGSANYRHLHTVDDIFDYCLSFIPKGFKFYTIAGNHDNSLNGRKHGFNLLAHLSMERNDINYIPSMRHYSQPVVVPGGAKAHLYHGIGMCRNARTSRLQKVALELIHMGSAADFIFCGHCHITSMLPFFMGKAIYGVGSFQNITPFLVDSGLVPEVSGLILSYNMKNSHPTRVCCEFLDYTTDGDKIDTVYGNNDYGETPESAYKNGYLGGYPQYKQRRSLFEF